MIGSCLHVSDVRVARRSAPVLPTKLLTGAAKCLVTQSCGDHRGELHHDGWGIGWYEHDMPRTIRSAGRASAEPLFTETAATVQSHLLMGHVRQASVGELSVENSHPFVWQRWMLAHNGTIEGFEHVAPRMTAEMSAAWLDHRRGHDRQRTVVSWLLARAEQRALNFTRRRRIQSDRNLLRQSIADLVAWSAAAPPPPDGEPTRLNLLLTDGATLWVTRWQYDLHYWERPGILIAASEPIGEGPWRELPEPSILMVRRGETAVIEPLLT